MMMVELEVFKNASGPFGLPMAIKQREMKSPGNNFMIGGQLTEAHLLISEILL